MQKRKIEMLGRGGIKTNDEELNQREVRHMPCDQLFRFVFSLLVARAEVRLMAFQMTA